MIGWLIVAGYFIPTLGTWISGAVRVGEQTDRNLAAKTKSYSFERAAYWTPIYQKAWAAFIAGLLWPIGLPIYIAFNKGKSIGLKKKQMKALLDEAEAEIARIKRKEGWS